MEEGNYIFNLIDKDASGTISIQELFHVKII
jgi:Ca2+-binding EF-hand superfamily protein